MLDRVLHFFLRGLLWGLALSLSALVLLHADAAQSLVYYTDQGHPLASDQNQGTSPQAPFLTIQHAVEIVGAGDTIVVRQGVYRERVKFDSSGTPAERITLMAAPGEHVAISGADVVNGWQICDAVICKGNAQASFIYYVDLDWEPLALFQESKQVQKARSPDVGWWVPTGGSSMTLEDSVNLPPLAGVWVGADVFFWEAWGNSQRMLEVASWDPLESSLGFAEIIPGGDIPDVADRYWVEDLVELISREGEWAVETLPSGLFRVYYLPLNGENPNNATVEGARRDRFIIEYNLHSHWVIRDFEIRHSANHGIGGFSTLSNNIEVSGCSIHHNVGTGIYGKGNDWGVYERNYVAYNEYGVNTLGSHDVLIESSEIAHNRVDGVIANGDNITVRGNYIHHHNQYGHPDNLQAYGDMVGLVVEDNLIASSGQSFMISEVSGALVKGNVIMGSQGFMIVMSDEGVTGISIEGNTLILTGHGSVGINGGAVYLRDNILAPSGHRGVFWGGVGPSSPFASDFNLFYHSELLPDDSTVVAWDSMWLDFDDYVVTSGHDSNSLYASPLFSNSPTVYARGAGNPADYRRDRIYLGSNDIALFEVGDNIEVEFDAVNRVVTAVGPDYIEFSPGEDRIAINARGVVNWRDNVDHEIDLTPLAGGPIAGASSGGGDIGSAINVRDFMQCDFDGDGFRDIPTESFSGLPLPVVPALLPIAHLVLVSLLCGAGGVLQGRSRIARRRWGTKRS